jgi:four helix bundle protein
MEEPDGLVEWAATNVPEAMRDDPIWRLAAYRYALYLADLVQQDIPKIRANPKTRSLTDQLISAVGSISANIAEGYSRASAAERARFFEYGESSAREAREWLFKVRHALDPDATTVRIGLATRIMKILTIAIKGERAQRQTRARRLSPDLKVPNQ